MGRPVIIDVKEQNKKLALSYLNEVLKEIHFKVNEVRYENNEDHFISNLKFKNHNYKFVKFMIRKGTIDDGVYHIGSNSISIECKFKYDPISKKNINSGEGFKIVLFFLIENMELDSVLISSSSTELMIKQEELTPMGIYNAINQIKIEEVMDL